MSKSYFYFGGADEPRSLTLYVALLTGEVYPIPVSTDELVSDVLDRLRRYLIEDYGLLDPVPGFTEPHLSLFYKGKRLKKDLTIGENGLDVEASSNRSDHGLRVQLAVNHFYEIDPKSGFDPDDVSTYQDVLWWAIDNDYLEVLENLYHYYGVTKESLLTTRAFRQAVFKGKTDVLRLFNEVYGLSKEDLQNNLDVNDLLVRLAYDEDEDGSAEILEALNEIYEFGAENTRVLNPETQEWRNPVLVAAVSSGNTEVLRVLNEVYGLGVEDIRLNNYEVLKRAAKEGQTRSLIALHDFYGLGPEDIRANHNIAIGVAARNRKYDFLRALRDVFGINGKDVRYLYRPNSYYRVVLGDDFSRMRLRDVFKDF